MGNESSTSTQSVVSVPREPPSAEVERLGRLGSRLFSSVRTVRRLRCIRRSPVFSLSLPPCLLPSSLPLFLLVRLFATVLSSVASHRSQPPQVSPSPSRTRPSDPVPSVVGPDRFRSPTSLLAQPPPPPRVPFAPVSGSSLSGPPPALFPGPGSPTMDSFRRSPHPGSDPTRRPGSFCRWSSKGRGRLRPPRRPPPRRASGSSSRLPLPQLTSFASSATPVRRGPSWVGVRGTVPGGVP